MDKQDSLKTILNHLLDTAVYVIRQDSHGILYFNDRVKTVTPDIALGQVCHDVWEGSCENLSLIHILPAFPANSSSFYVNP